MHAGNPDNGGIPIDDTLRQRIEALARRRDSSPQDIVRQAFNEFEARHANDELSQIEEEETIFDRMKKLGVIGCYDAESPGDLSTNRKYMEGFGRD